MNQLLKHLAHWYALLIAAIVLTLPYLILLQSYEEIATPSISRISTAICARFAASATRLKSRRKGEVSVLCCGGGTCAAGCFCCGADVGPLEEEEFEDEVGACAK